MAETIKMVSKNIIVEFLYHLKIKLKMISVRLNWFLLN